MSLSNDHSSVDSIANIAPTPILVFHSPDDWLAPIDQGRALFDAAGEPKEFVEVPVAGHPVVTLRPAERERLLRFFDECLAE
ncbi:MAG: hypothetical protein WD226_02540 [Planctomycetota bacterium]